MNDIILTKPFRTSVSNMLDFKTKYYEMFEIISNNNDLAVRHKKIDNLN